MQKHSYRLRSHNDLSSVGLLYGRADFRLVVVAAQRFFGRHVGVRPLPVADLVESGQLQQKKIQDGDYSC